jgi:hypothetical protein
MIEGREGGIESLEMIENRAGAIYIEWCPELLRRPAQIDLFAMKFAGAIFE